MTGNYSWWCHSVKGSVPPPLLLCAAPPACLTFDRHFFRVQAERCWQFVAAPGQKLNMGQYLCEWTWRKRWREEERMQQRAREWESSFGSDTEQDTVLKKMTPKDLRNNVCCHGLFMPMSFNFYLHAKHIIPKLDLFKSSETSQTAWGNFEWQWNTMADFKSAASFRERKKALLFYKYKHKQASCERSQRQPFLNFPQHNCIPFPYWASDCCSSLP